MHNVCTFVYVRTYIYLLLFYFVVLFQVNTRAMKKEKENYFGHTFPQCTPPLPQPTLPLLVQGLAVVVGSFYSRPSSCFPIMPQCGIERFSVNDCRGSCWHGRPRTEKVGRFFIFLPRKTGKKNGRRQERRTGGVFTGEMACRPRCLDV